MMNGVKKGKHNESAWKKGKERERKKEYTRSGNGVGGKKTRKEGRRWEKQDRRGRKNGKGKLGRKVKIRDVK